ncbi:Cdc14 [Strongyloides ratti]|uniref:protein-tyrosine-phosphatase n=1 Tax=Strongyloides ratti TaxID=34506 RepID=A0A090L9L8_STRRB|nr:Cdc14 [Strongyloides ratti]CEF64823.1 Cdc14 [Strongyloides ratti]
MRHLPKRITEVTNQAAHEVITLMPRLYFSVFGTKITTDSKLKYIFLFINDHTQYVPFADDFGPIDITGTIKFLQIVKAMHNKFTNSHLFICCLNSEKERLNTAVLAGAYLILYERVNLEDVYNILTSSGTINYINFLDASNDSGAWKMDLKSALSGFVIGFQYQFFSLNSFNIYEHDHYGLVQHGDLNWIIPDKLMAFAKPSEETFIDHYPPNSPARLAPLFVTFGVTAIVQTNERDYDALDFTKFGIKHYTLTFEDMTEPPPEYVLQFLKICNEEKSIAVHCKSGLGRTGTLIVCYMMWKFKIKAEACIAWLRLARPGSVLTVQAAWLIKMYPLIATLTIEDIENNNVGKLKTTSTISSRKSSFPIKSTTISTSKGSPIKPLEKPRTRLRKAKISSTGN